MAIWVLKGKLQHFYCSHSDMHNVFSVIDAG